MTSFFLAGRDMDFEALHTLGMLTGSGGSSCRGVKRPCAPEGVKPLRARLEALNFSAELAAEESLRLGEECEEACSAD